MVWVRPGPLSSGARRGGCHSRYRILGLVGAGDGRSRRGLYLVARRCLAHGRRRPARQGADQKVLQSWCIPRGFVACARTPGRGCLSGPDRSWWRTPHWRYRDAASAGRHLGPVQPPTPFLVRDPDAQWAFAAHAATPFATCRGFIQPLSGRVVVTRGSEIPVSPFRGQDRFRQRRRCRQGRSFPSRQHESLHLSVRQYARIVKRWVALIGPEPPPTHCSRTTR
jgi:hypothetical protein